MKHNLSTTQRAAILQAALDARQRGPVALKVQSSELGTNRLVLTYDAVDLACDTSNYWWSGLDNRHCLAALRLIHRSLEHGR